MSHALLTGNSSKLRLLSNPVGQPGFPSLPERREGWANVPTDRFLSICPAVWSAGSMAAFPDPSLTVLTCRELHSHGGTPLSARSGVICTTKGSDGCFLVWDSKVQSSPVGLMHQGCHKEGKTSARSKEGKTSLSSALTPPAVIHLIWKQSDSERVVHF